MVDSESDGDNRADRCRTATEKGRERKFAHVKLYARSTRARREFLARYGSYATHFECENDRSDHH